MNITDDRLEKALRYLASTDESCANLKADSERAEFKAKAIKDAIFIREDGTVAERQAIAGASKEYAAEMDAHFKLMAQFEAVKNKRTTETIVVDTWRTIQANQRRGNI